MIKITDKYYIDGDKYNYILKEKKIQTKGKNIGKEIMVDVGYHSSVELCVRQLISLIDKNYIHNNEIDFRDIVVRLEENRAEVLKDILNILEV